MSTTTISELTRFTGPVDTSNYQDFKKCVIRALFKRMKHYTSRAWSPYFYGGIILTNAQYNAIVNLRLTTNAPIALDDPHYDAKKKDLRDETLLVDAFTTEVKSKLTSTAIIGLDAISYAPTIDQILTFMEAKYATAPTQEKINDEEALSNAITWPTDTNEIVSCQEQLENRFTNFFEKVMPEATEAEKERLKVKNLTAALKHTIAKDTNKEYIKRELPETYTSDMILAAINKAMRNWNFDTKPTGNALAVKKTEHGNSKSSPTETTTHNKKCLVCLWNPSHTSKQCYLVHNVIKNLTDDEIANIRSNKDRGNRGRRNRNNKPKAKKANNNDSDSASETDA